MGQINGHGITAYGNPDASIVLIQAVDDHDLAGMENETAEIRKLTAADFCLLAVRVQNWNNDLSPWAAPAVFGKEAFGGGASDTLAEVLEHTAGKGKTYYLGGYSLAGLFSLWAGYNSELCNGIAAASPSVWYPRWTEYIEGKGMHSKAVYLSLGDRESRTKNPVMAHVDDAIRLQHELVSAQGIATTLEWNPGGHFVDSEKRMAKAFGWAVENL